ncbi:MAG TPA: cytochrome b [Phenylobacterium sp.]|jgi:cytochrome b561|uniref:cytochrome b n=1 Tax=Phenylobacterium sp. TaxID=1871053 RepID=UPI002D6C5926|nr:cytochrome b [Phenylobacterium sp.]HZZ66949.1 cytochrome b [Phenylobacterium sp.]
MNSTPTGGKLNDVAEGRRRYATAAIWMHWTIAALLLIQIALGWIMNEVLPDHTPSQRLAESIHISLGLTILILVVARIALRLTHRPPPLPADMPGWERTLSGLVHFTFYLLMLAMPLTGWALVSLADHSISFWGLPWPHLPGIQAMLGNPAPKATRQAVKHIHVFILIWIFMAAWTLHVAGALKHQFDGRPVLWRMTWLRPSAAR